MNSTIDISASNIDWPALVEGVARTGATVRIARGTEVVAEINPPSRRHVTVADFVNALENGPRLGREEADLFAADLEAARREIDALGVKSPWDS